jgi:hypothetical protein
MLSSTMLVKVNSIDTIKNKVKVTQLDIDDYGSVIPLKELELNISADGESIIQTLKNSSYAAIEFFLIRTDKDLQILFAQRCPV